MTTGVTAEQDAIKMAREEIEKRTGKTPEQLYEEKERRLRDATELREPDRVPFGLSPGDFTLRYFGALLKAEFYEPGVYRQAIIKVLLDFDPDFLRPAYISARSGLALETIGSNYERWPGFNLPPDAPYQALHGLELMKEDEYDIFMTDPSDFILRYLMPRKYSALEPLAKLPPLGGITNGVTLGAIFTVPELQKAAQMLLKAGQELKKSQGQGDAFADLGFPPYNYSGGVGGSPFDYIGGNLRGVKIMTDIYQRPEKLLATCERVLEWQLARALPADPTKRGHPRRASGGSPSWSSLLSKKHFQIFAWPTWKKALLATIDLGFIPWVSFEGQCDNIWEYFLELPKGKFIIAFQQHGDMTRAKEIFGGHCCLQGHLPPGLIELGSPQEVEEYCKNLIKVCGKGGGFILDNGSTLSDAKPANVKAMADSVKKYGRY